jgi:PAS domain S-box-containing protein
VLGTFAMYHRAPRVPSDEDLANIDIITRTATIAIERYRAERELRDRAERLRVTLASIGDAVVVTDARGHVTFLNAVAEGVTGWAMSEAEGRPLREVFRIINESTRAAVDSPVEKVLREGRIVGLANHTLLIRKDGREVPIDDSAAPIRDREDRISGVVLVFRDISERKETETALREGAQRLGLALSASGLGDWSWEAGTDVVTFSPRAAEIFGIPPGPVMTWTRMRELLHPEDRERARMGVERAVADHSDYDIEYRVARPEGGHRWVSARGRATYDPEGGVTGMLGVVQDIDARKREEEARADRESLTALRADVAEALSKSDSRDAALRACCEALVGWLGMAFARIWLLDPAEEVLELRASAGMYTRLDGTHARIRVGAFKIGRIARVRQPHLTNRLADDPFLGDPEWAGREGLTAFAGYPLTVGDRVVGVMAMFSRRAIPEGVFGELALVADGIAQFIDRKRLEEERQRLRVREMRRSRQFRELADAAAAANTLTSLDAALKVITEKALQIVGVHQAVTSMTVDLNWAQAINTVALSDKYAAWRDYSAPPDGSGIYSLVCRNNRTMRLTQAELEAHPAYRRFGKDAAAHPPMRGWLAAPLVGRNGRNLGLIQLSDKVDGGDFDEDDEAILIQLAQLASVAVENAWLYREAQEAARTKDEFLAVVSHELRTPMNAIVGWVQMLKSGQLNFLEGQQALEVVERNAKAQTQLINDLLDVSRIISGKMMLESRPVPLEAVVRAALDTVRLSAEAKGLRLEAAMEAGLPPVSGDADRLQQVVWNLLTNAVKFTPKGGQVTVALRRTNSHAEIAVRDNGQGIAAEFLPHIFGRFRQADAASTRKHGGLGLGLSIVRNLVELHGGTVRAESDGPGRGAAFTVTLPFRAVRSETEAEPEPEPEPEAGLGPRQAIPADGRAPRRLDGLRILIVDDEPDARMMVGTVLSKMGARVTAADSAREALRSLEDRLPDLLISDIGMPYQDGYELIRRVRALPPERGGRLPAIALTAFARAEDRERALAAGFQLHVPKPVEPAVLAAAVSGLVGSAAAEPVGAGG